MFNKQQYIYKFATKKNIYIYIQNFTKQKKFKNILKKQTHIMLNKKYIFLQNLLNKKKCTKI